MIILKNITLRNFLSIGAVTQAVNFDSNELTLILGENLDMGGDGARNGTGKTTLIQGLSYALFGTPINSIRKDNLINRTNAKGMMITLEFSANGTEYKIERGRRPNILKFYVNSDLQESLNDAQGENKETQIQIERAIGMTPDMFKHIIALNTYSEPFLAMKANDQRNIIEQLLGITLLSEKADIIKDQLRGNKEAIQLEEFTVKAIEEANKRVQEQIEATKRRQKLWLNKHAEDLSKLVNTYDELSKIDIEIELQSHKDLAEYNTQKKKKETHEALLARQIAWKQKQDREIEELQVKYNELNSIDFSFELSQHHALTTYNKAKLEQETIKATISTQTKSIEKEKKLIEKLKKEVRTLDDHKCYACGQELHDDKHTEVMLEKSSLLEQAKNDLIAFQAALEINKALVLDLGVAPVTHYKTETEAIKLSSGIENIQKQIENKKTEVDPYEEQLIEHPLINIGSQPTTHYDTETEAIQHRTTVDSLFQQIERNIQEVDPYSEQVTEMEHQALQEINFNKINELTRFGDHLKFLLDLLTSKDSFVRKKIIDQNLSYLNARLTNYLDKIGLPHTVVFKNDLSVEITELGRELDFDNLSRGERNRLILGLSFAFRDVWENLYFPINTLFIDELIDSGLDTVGVENAMVILKDMSRRRNKSVWLVSHREELAGRVPSVLKVIKEAGFTTYSTTTDIQH